MDKKGLIKALDYELKKEGFQRKSMSWYLDEEKIIKVVNLQKSNYANLYYVNLGIFFKKTEKSKQPRADQCHVRTRLNDIMVNAPKDYDYLFNLEDLQADKKNYEREIKNCVEQNIIPQLEAIKSKEGILEIAKSEPAILNMLTIEAKEYLGI